MNEWAVLGAIMAYADIIADRQKWREEINSLESELKNRGL